MEFSKSLEELKKKLNQSINSDATALKNAFDNVKDEIVKYVSDSAGAYKFFQDYSPEKDLAQRDFTPEGFVYGYEKIPSINAKDTMSFPLIYPFLNVGATAIEENSDCASFFFNFALRSIISYPLGDSIVYLIDSNVSGDFNMLSPICTELDDTDSEKNTFHYITTEEDINKVIQELTQNMDRIIKHISRYPDLQSYNRENPYTNEPYRFLFIKDITEAFTDKHQIDKLARLINSMNATKAGIYIFFTYNKNKLANTGNSYFSENCTAIQHLISISQVMNHHARNYADAVLSIEPKASRDDAQKVIDFVRKQVPPRNPVMTFKSLIERTLSKGTLWKPSYTRQPNHLYFPVGYVDVVTPKEIDIQFVGDKSPHLLIGGSSGSGKTILLHNFILNGALRYSPDELQFYLADMKGGLSFVPYKQLPHVAALCASSSPHYVESLLDLFCQEIEKRTSLFKNAGVQKLEDYNEKARSKRQQILPYLFGIIDEFQTLFKDNGNISNKAKRHIETIHEKGRSQGVFIALCSQEPPDINKSQIGYKLSTSCVIQSSHKILGNEGASKLRGMGRAILNTDKASEEKYNQIFQVAYIDEQNDLPVYIQKIKNIYLRENNGNDKYDHLIYDDNDESAKISENPIIMHPESVHQNDTPYIYIGLPGFYRKEHVKFCFHRDSNSNVAICGTDRPSALRLVGIITIQFLRFYRDLGARVFIADMQRQTEPTCNKLEFLSKKQEVSHSRAIDLTKTIGEVYKIMCQRKQDTTHGVHEPEVLFSILDIKPDGFPTSNPYNFNFSFGGSSSEPEEKSSLSMLNELIAEGPNYGIHTLIYGYNSDNFAILQQPQDLLKMMEVKIALRGGNSYRIIRNIGSTEIVDKFGNGYIYLPEEMGLKYNDSDSYGDPFRIYNALGDSRFLHSVWDILFKNLPNKN